MLNMATNPLLVELSRPETLTDSERQLRLLGCARNQMNNNLLEYKDIISPLVKFVASNNASVKVSEVLSRMDLSNLEGLN